MTLSEDQIAFREFVWSLPGCNADDNEEEESTMTTKIEMLPDMIGWNKRPPTAEECELVGRDVDYAQGGNYSEGGDYVIETLDVAEGQEHFARAFEAFGMCDAAHVIPNGVYLEE